MLEGLAKAAGAILLVVLAVLFILACTEKDLIEAKAAKANADAWEDMGGHLFRKRIDHGWIYRHYDGYEITYVPDPATLTAEGR